MPSEKHDICELRRTCVDVHTLTHVLLIDKKGCSTKITRESYIHTQDNTKVQTLVTLKNHKPEPTQEVNPC